MASADQSMDDEAPPRLPAKHVSTRVVTPSPAMYDQPAPAAGYQAVDPGQQRPVSVHSNQSHSQPGTPSPGYGLVDPYPQTHGGSQHSSRAGSQAGSRASSRASIQMAPQPYPGMQGITQEPQYTQQQMSTYGASPIPQSPGVDIKPPSSMQMKRKAPSQRRPKPEGMKLILKSWIIMSIGTIFVNPVFGGIGLGFSIVSLISDNYITCHKFGRLALFTCIVGIALSIILAIVAGIILGTNNKGWHKDVN